MPKAYDQPRRLTSGLIPGGDISVLTDINRLKEQVASLKPKERQRTIAFLCGIYHTHKLSDLLGVKKSYINYCCNTHRAITEAAHVGRNFSIMDLAERKTIELISHLDPATLSNDKRAQSAKYMMEVAELAGLQTAPPKEDDDVDTMSLVFKLKKRMVSSKEIEQDATIDITPQVEIK